MIAIRAQHPATLMDLESVPENMVGEIIRGCLTTSPRPSPRHANASSVLGGDLSGPFHLGRGGPGGWRLLDEPELHLDDDVLVPDLAGWRRERLPQLADEAAFTLCPDWVCEVLSPATARMDRIEKMPIYASAGVQHLWLIDPVWKSLEVFRLADGCWLLLGMHRDDERVRAEPFEAVELELTPLWG